MEIWTSHLSIVFEKSLHFAKQFALLRDISACELFLFLKREEQKWSSTTFKSFSLVKRYLKLRYSEQKRSKNILWKLWIQFLSSKLGSARFVHVAFSIWLTQTSFKPESQNMQIASQNGKYNREMTCPNIGSVYRLEMLGKQTRITCSKLQHFNLLCMHST